MNIHLDRKMLADKVGIVARFAERKILSLPALSGIAIVAEQNTIHLKATNLETSISLVVEGSVNTPGSVALPANIFRDITASFSGNGPLTLEQKNDVVSLTSDKGKSTIKTLPFEDFPTLSLPDAPKSQFSLSGALLRSLIGVVAPYASTSTVRPELASVFISAEGGVVKAVATDSFRLAEKKLPLSGSVKPFTMLIPAKNALDLVHTIPDDDIQVSANEHQCAFSWKGGIAMTRLVAMTYPDYAQIVPKSFSAEATVLKKDFESALKRTAVFSDAFQKIRIGLIPKEKTLSLSAHNADIGESSETIAATVSGDALELSFNHRYLFAPLQSLTADSITLQAAGIGRPLVIKGSGDQSFLYLVMPMNQ